MSPDIKPPRDPELLRRAASVGTPTYVYDLEVVHRRCRSLLDALSPLPSRLLYAVKANPQPALLKAILAEGIGLEAVSAGEVHLALRLGVPSGSIFFSANNMSDAEMEHVHALGALFNIGELSRLERFGRQYPGEQVSIRINPDVGAGHHRHVVTAGKSTKFGIPLDHVSRALDVARTYGLRVIGLHQHIGSGIDDTRQLREAMSVLLDTAPQFPDLEFLDFGGGLNVPYRPDEKPLDIENIRVNIVEPLERFLFSFQRPLSFWFEPGRYLVAEAGTLLTRVTTLKESGGRLFAGTDSGFNHLIRPVLYDAYHAIYNLSNPDGPPKRYDVVGNICETGDVFARDRRIQEIREGDLLAILDAGAYGIAMASEYNLRPLPAEIVFHRDGTPQVVRRRLTASELVDRLLHDTAD